MAGLMLVVYGWLAGVAISWAGAGMLLILSFVWPGNPVPPSLLAAWAVATAVAVIKPWPPRSKWSSYPPRQMAAVGPFLPLFRVGMACYDACRKRNRKRRH